MAKGKGGQQTQKTTLELPPEIREEALKNLAMARQVGRIGYVPYQGPTVAALTPMQRAAMQQTRDAARAFGMNPGNAPPGIDPLTGMNRGAIRNVGGVRGYSAMPIYRNAKGKIKPGQRKAIDQMFGKKGR